MCSIPLESITLIIDSNTAACSSQSVCLSELIGLISTAPASCFLDEMRAAHSSMLWNEADRIGLRARHRENDPLDLSRTVSSSSDRRISQRLLTDVLGKMTFTKLTQWGVNSGNTAIVECPDKKDVHIGWRERGETRDGSLGPKGRCDQS